MTHFLDSDGVSTHLFHVLGKDSKRFEAARVFIPPTIVFDNGFASAWYNSTPNMEVKLHMAKNITAELILVEFAGNAEPHDIVATFIEVNSVSRDTEVPVISSYFTRDDLEDFLCGAGQKPRGLLQKFEYPKGLCNATIQATWSPSVTVAEALRNPYSIADRGRTAAERCATFESKLASQVALTNSVFSAVKRVCELVAEHIQLLEPLQVVGMVLHLKVTQSNRVTLLFSTSMRVVQRKSFNAASSVESHPLLLNQNFVTREEHTRAQDLKHHLALFGPKPHVAGTVQSPKTVQSPPRFLRPIQTDSPTRTLLYAGRIAALTSFVSSPNVVPSVVMVNQRWLATGAKCTSLPPVSSSDPQSKSNSESTSTRDAKEDPVETTAHRNAVAHKDEAPQSERHVAPDTGTAPVTSNEESCDPLTPLRDCILELVYDLQSLVTESPVGPLYHQFAVCGLQPQEWKIVSSVLENFAPRVDEVADADAPSPTAVRRYSIADRTSLSPVKIISIELAYKHRFKAVSTMKVRARGI